MNRRSLAVLFGLAAIAVTGCGGGGGTSGGGGGGGGGTDFNIIAAGGSGVNSVILRGRVVDSDFGTPIGGVRVDLYSATGSVLGSNTSNSQGYVGFQTNVTAASVHIVRSSVNTTAYFGTYLYSGSSYSMSVPTCRAGLGVLAPGSDITLPTLQLIPTTSVPPLPPTCP
ncbi:MAG: hypothetical protein JNM85_00715 [Chthonomonas sp.]|nr:hypothetical protein [Chthonomonas sp.]